MAIQQLLTFEGGLSTKIDEHLIGRNEAIVYSNIDANDGSIDPLKGFSLLGSSDGMYTTYYNGEYISNTNIDDERFYAEYGGRLYWTNASYGSYGLMKYVDDPAGVDAVAPDKFPIATIPISVTEVSVDSPRLTVGAKYFYAFTIVDNDDIESEPIFEEAPELTSGKTIRLSVNKALMDAYFTANIGYSVNVYRTGGNNPTYNLIIEGLTGDSQGVIDTGTEYQYNDLIADIDVSRRELTTFENTPPPDGLDMLIELRGTMWGAVGNRVYFSKTGAPEFWSPLDFVVLDRACTGIGVFGDSIVAFTDSSPYLITGYNRDTIQIQKLPYNQGCINKNCITNIDTYLIWTSKNGICLFDGSSIQVLTKNKVLWESFQLLGEKTFEDFGENIWNAGDGFDISYSLGYKDKYFGIYTGGILVVDLASGMKVSTIDTSTDTDIVGNLVSLLFNKDDNILIAVDSEFNLHGYQISNSTMLATYKSGRLADEGTTITKHYRDVEVDGNPESIDVYVNGSLICSHEGKNKFKLPAGSFGRDIQFGVTTTEEIRSIKYEYSVKKA